MAPLGDREGGRMRLSLISQETCLLLVRELMLWTTRNWLCRLNEF